MNASESAHDVPVSSTVALPTPEVLQRYNDLIPGFAESLVSLIAEEHQHRRKLENQIQGHNDKKLDAEIMLAKRGQGFALFATIIVISGAVAAAACQAHLAATIIGGGGAIGLAAVFIKGKVIPGITESSKSIVLAARVARIEDELAELKRELFRDEPGE